MRVAILPLVAVLCCFLWPTAVVADDFLQLVVYGKGAGSADALADLEMNTTAYANKFTSKEGPSSYNTVQKGSSINPTNRRQLDVGCPNSCSNSGRTYCVVLGCAYCGTCGGRRQLKIRGGQDRSLQWVKSAAEQREIEANFDMDFSKYCVGKNDCELYARVMRIYSNGTIVRAH